MEQNHNNTVAVANLIKNEELLSDLYKKYSTLFSDDAAFWLEISDDETTHAGWLYDLSEKVSRGELFISNDRFRDQAYIGFGEYVTEKINEAGTDILKPIDALSIAKDIEKSMLEDALFKIYDTDNPLLKQVLDKLRISTEEHRDEITERWKNELNTA